MTIRAAARPLLGIPAAFLLLSCSGRARPVFDIPAARDTIWYISARARDHGRDTRQLADSLEYGMVVSHFRGNGALFVDGLDVAPVDSVRLAASDFAVALRAR